MFMSFGDEPLDALLVKTVVYDTLTRTHCTAVADTVQSSSQFVLNFGETTLYSPSLSLLSGATKGIGSDYYRVLNALADQSFP